MNEPTKRTPRRSKPGPRHTRAKADVTRKRLFALAQELGPEDLTIREVANRASYSPRMVMYVFGSLAGLHAAVAAKGYEELNQRLEKARRAAADGEALREVAVAYLRFGLAEETIWRTMHSRTFWSSFSDPEAREHAECSAWVKTQPGRWKDDDIFQAVYDSRDNAINCFRRAADQSGKVEAHRLVQVIAALIDGFLWQTHFEQERTASADYVELIDRVISEWR